MGDKLFIVYCQWEVDRGLFYITLWTGGPNILAGIVGPYCCINTFWRIVFALDQPILDKFCMSLVGSISQAAKKYVDMGSRWHHSRVCVALYCDIILWSETLILVECPWFNLFLWLRRSQKDKVSCIEPNEQVYQLLMLRQEHNNLND